GTRESPRGEGHRRGPGQDVRALAPAPGGPRRGRGRRRGGAVSGDYGRELSAAIAAAREAGALLRGGRHRAGGPRGAGDHADVDPEAERLVRDRLAAATAFSFRGEELGFVAGADPSHVWVVDPNDGTESFLRGARGPAVSIGLVRAGMPVA